MTRKTTTTITIQTSSRTIVRPLGPLHTVPCEQCGADASVMTPEDVVSILRIPPGKIYEMLESGRLHVLEEPSGSLLLCFNQLPAASTETDIQIEGENQ
jgi:hypothetical protein